MRIGKDRRGFSLVELIIVISIMAILTGVSVTAMGFINSGKTKKASNALDNKLDYIQTQTMTKKGTAYLYLYAASDGIYTYVHTTDTSYPDGFDSRTELDSYMTSESIEGSRLCDNNVTVKLTGQSGSGSNISLTLNSGNMLKIGHSKSTGEFICSNDGTAGSTDFYDFIELDGKQKFSIKMIKATGKHFIKKG